MTDPTSTARKGANMCVDDVAARFKSTRAAVHQMVYRGQITPAWRIGGKQGYMFFDDAEIEKIALAREDKQRRLWTKRGGSTA